MLGLPRYENPDYVMTDAWGDAAHGIWDVREIWMRDKTQVFTSARHARIAYALLLIHNECPEWVKNDQGQLPSLDNQDGNWLWSEDQNNPSAPAVFLLDRAKQSEAIRATLDALTRYNDETVIRRYLERRFGIRS